jgi:hypothetical protein
VLSEQIFGLIKLDLNMLLLDQQIKPLLLWIRTAIIKDIEMKYAEYTKDVQRLANTFKTELLIVTVTLTFIF